MNVNGNLILSLNLKKSIVILLLSVVSYFAIWRGHAEPHSLVWDEHFHIVSAEKYLNSIYFQEPHPPLGKLLIAAGEKLFGDDPQHSEFTQYDRSPKTPDNFSPVGYRFFPALVTCVLPLLLFDLIFLTTNRLGAALLISLLLIFDTALPMHSRTAHLEGFQLFFMLAFLSSFLRLRRSAYQIGWSVLAGLFFGLAAATKVTSLILLPFTFFYPGSLKELRRYLNPSLTLFISAITFLVVFYVHFSLGRHIQEELTGKGYYGAKDETKLVIDDNVKNGTSLSTFPILFSEWIEFFNRYEKGVPKLNICKSQENGSYPLIWPLGGGTISYSWKKTDDRTQYFYLIPNAVVWGLSLLGFIFGLANLVSRFTSPNVSETNEQPQFSPPISELSTLLYIAYYVAMLHVDRVMYLYHAFVPLVFGLILFGVETSKFRAVCGVLLTNRIRILTGLILFFLALTNYFYFRPLVTFNPLTEEQFNSRKWFDLWNLKCANCSSNNPIGKPILTSEEKIQSKDYWRITIDGVKATKVEQEWGEPKMDTTIESKPIVIGGEQFATGVCTHARSRIEIKIPDNTTLFQTQIGVADSKADDDDPHAETRGSVIFEVRLDSQIVYTSNVLRSGMKAKNISLPVAPDEKLELFVYDAGDGNAHDHGCWVNPKLVKSKVGTAE